MHKHMAALALSPAAGAYAVNDMLSINCHCCLRSHSGLFLLQQHHGCSHNVQHTQLSNFELLQPDILQLQHNELMFATQPRR